MMAARGGGLVALGVICLGVLGCGATRSVSARPQRPPPEASGGSGRSVEGEGTGSVSVVDGDALHGVAEAQLEPMLEGRVAGGQGVRLPGGGISVRIRGQGSIGGDT